MSRRESRQGSHDRHRNLDDGLDSPLQRFPIGRDGLMGKIKMSADATESEKAASEFTKSSILTSAQWSSNRTRMIGASGRSRAFFSKIASAASSTFSAGSVEEASTLTAASSTSAADQTGVVGGRAACSSGLNSST